MTPGTLATALDLIVGSVWSCLRFLPSIVVNALNSSPSNAVTFLNEAGVKALHKVEGLSHYLPSPCHRLPPQRFLLSFATGNDIGPEGATALAKALEVNGSVRTLHLNGKCPASQAEVVGPVGCHLVGHVPSAGLASGNGPPSPAQTVLHV